jgi:hypothetical protein
MEVGERPVRLILGAVDALDPQPDVAQARRGGGIGMSLNAVAKAAISSGLK